MRWWLSLFGLLFFLMLVSCQKTISGNGVVLDKNTGLPVNNAVVQAFLDHPSPDAFQMRTVTDASGRYFVSSDPQVCTGSCPDLYVEISKEGYEGAYIKNPHGDTTFLQPSP